MKHIERDIALDSKTTLRIGGPASYYAAARSAEHVAELAAWAKSLSLPVLLLGKGSNMLISDEGWPGLAIELGACFTNIQWNGVCARCDGGAAVSALVLQSVDRGLAGMQYLAGIPGTVGGGLIMNAGAFDQEISQCLDWVDIMNIDSGARNRFRRAEIEFGYRSSSLKRDGVLVLEAQFCFEKGDKQDLRAAYDQTLSRRRERQPLDRPNCGSVFKRPKDNFAGALIEQCGCKGLRIGDACVSEKHANFIVNMGAASAGDVRRLIAEIQRRVYESHGVKLEPEVVFAGDFSTPLFTPAQ
jgi:UDP-N-acetylmuramate dehydrogenase